MQLFQAMAGHGSIVDWFDLAFDVTAGCTERILGQPFLQVESELWKKEAAFRLDLPNDVNNFHEDELMSSGFGQKLLKYYYLRQRQTYVKLANSAAEFTYEKKSQIDLY